MRLKGGVLGGGPRPLTLRAAAVPRKTALRAMMGSLLCKIVDAPLYFSVATWLFQPLNAPFSHGQEDTDAAVVTRRL